MKKCLQCGVECEHKFCNDTCRQQHIAEYRAEQERVFKLKAQALKEKRQFVRKYNRTHIETYD